MQQDDFSGLIDFMAKNPFVSFRLFCVGLLFPKTVISWKQGFCKIKNIRLKAKEKPCVWKKMDIQTQKMVKTLKNLLEDPVRLLV